MRGDQKKNVLLQRFDPDPGCNHPIGHGFFIAADCIGSEKVISIGLTDNLGWYDLLTPYRVLGSESAPKAYFATQQGTIVGS